MDPSDFRITTFASGLDNPLAMQELSDGSLVVGVDGALLRFADADADGVADGPGAVSYGGLPGLVTSVRLAGDLAFVASAQTIFLLRQGAAPADPFTLLGSFDIEIPFPWSHISFTLAVREVLTDVYELYFNVGSKTDDTATTEVVSVTGLITGSVNPDAIYRVQVDNSGQAPVLSGLVRIASGVRNAFGIAFHPTTGDLYFEDNSIDGPTPPFEVSVDELNVIALADIGGAVEDFGFPDNYIAYRTGVEVGSGGIDPIVAFQPIPAPNGSESEGPAEIRFAPPLFPAGLNAGLFVGFHGLFGDVGTTNTDNPLVYVDLNTLEYFHFISNTEPSIGHLDGLLATQDSLFIADFTNSPGVLVPGAGTIYQIKALGDPAIPALPWPWLIVAALAVLAATPRAARRWVRHRHVTE